LLEPLARFARGLSPFIGTYRPCRCTGDFVFPGGDITVQGVLTDHSRASLRSDGGHESVDPMDVVRARTRLAYPALLALGALDAAGYSIIAPVLPAISAGAGAGPALIGVLVAAFPLGIVVAFPLAGRAIAARGTRPMLVVSLILLAVGSLGFAAGGGLPAYFAFRFVMGLGSGGLWLAVTFNTLERWPGQAYLCMSRLFAAYSVGGLLGPAIGAIGGIRMPFAVYGVLAVAALVLALAVPPSEHSRIFRPDRSALRVPGFWAASGGILFAVLALGIIEGLLPLHFADRLGQAQIGALYIGMSVVVAGAAALAGRFGPVPMVLGSVALVTAGLGVAGATSSPLVWITALIIAGTGVGMGNVGSTGLLLDAVPSERIITAMVVWSELGILGYLAGPLAGGPVVQSFGFPALALVPAAAGVALLATVAWAKRMT
jgi:MFS family permease